jgi:RHH-type proline utilization regulon transcriptional repressor/proline dehydrogenase/delta 1-pyrroline-5-carboxylate dehydrogenase
MSVFTFPTSHSEITSQRAAITAAYRKDETECLSILLKAAELPEVSLQEIEKTAEKLVISVREQRLGKGGIDAFLYEYDLSTEEGIALMCLAESMLRVSDNITLDRLIQDKITAADWDSHRGKSDSSFVNAASWALMLTGKILTPEETKSGIFGDTLKRFVKRTSEPVIRKAMSEAMRILGKQFVMGRTINEAVDRSRSNEKLGYRFSYDMLGEGARTAEDAERYFQAYHSAIKVIGKAARGKGIYAGAGISIKLSALHPRYEFSQQERSIPLLIERLRALALEAKAADIGLTVDAEESDRLEISLDIMEAVIADPALKDWNGFGLALQAYQKRAFYVIDWLAAMAKKHRCRLMLRLVKGAYWDTEIKDSQVRGLADYPVFTRKASTDVSYLACAKKIIEYGDLFYPQFATHNAYTVAAILEMMGQRRDFEFQCLKGMGRALYDQIVASNKMAVPCRIYAPVGQHEDLLPYLVRRLLENGANSSFVNRIVDEKTPIKDLLAHPIEKISKLAYKPHPKIKLPSQLYPDRMNSQGLDLTNPNTLEELTTAMDKALTNPWYALPTIAPKPKTLREVQGEPVVDPSDHKRQIGTRVYSTKEEIEESIQVATKAAPAWNAIPVTERAACLEKLADLIEANRAELMALLAREAGKCMPDAQGEVREAVDFCRYYANLGRTTLAPIVLDGPTGEFNQLEMHGRGVFFCVSPWNFPLAIFAGQVVAALITGNCVLAKPAEQTSLIGAKAVELMHQAGIPKEVVQLIPGKGSVLGPLLTTDNRINGIMFTGSTETARGINQVLAQRDGPIVPFIAETGGQNALIADSTALPEQLVNDVILSAFNSAGQRCSALRVLFLQDEMADRVITLLKGAMQELKVGDPAKLSTDIGPVINEASRKTLEAHVARMNKEAKLIAEVPMSKETQHGTFFAPRAYEIPSLDILEREVFGPILHIIRYKSKDLDTVINTINNNGYGLTLGIHTRIKTTADYILQRVRVGNRYVNRNMIGAVVGVQPFGGEGLSGTGPKAGGPHYLSRLCNERSLAENTTAAGGNASLMSLVE